MSDYSRFSIDSKLFQSAATRVSQRCDELAGDSEVADYLQRTFCTPAMKSAHRRLDAWMNAADLVSHLDAVGNLIGRPREPVSDRVLMIGSHLDTVINAGRFDGMLGVLLGLATVEVLNESGIQLRFDIHVVAFSEEEGVRFRLPFIGSRGIAGSFDEQDLERLDDDGISLRHALEQFGCDSDQWTTASYAEKNLIGFMEVHIEQAVVLQEADSPVGVVSAIAGQSRATIEFKGFAGHAGTVPHDRRRDALAAAAELILKNEQLGRSTPGLFATVGNVVAKPGLSNVISGLSELRLDLRHAFDAERMVAFKKIQSFINDISTSRHVAGSIIAQQHTPAVPMDQKLSDHLATAVQAIGVSPQSLVSGAGHDAMIMAKLAPSCMLFVRCRDGISHHPDEFVSTTDIESALKVMVNALLALSNSRS